MDDQPVSSKPQTPGLFDRLRDSLKPAGIPTDERGRMRMVLDSLILHLHPARVPESTLRWTYTWGLGGLSALLMVILAVTGIFLQMNYTPNPSQAYLDILALRSNTWFGDLLRNLHHWSANLLIITSVLHLLRVFFTGAHRPPRELNWLIGLITLLLVLAANFTGYLLPWDQLAYWAITVGTGLIRYLPVVGNFFSRLLLGGPEVSASTLLNFYALHISFVPLGIMALLSYHFWRVRKDGGLTLPKPADQPGEPKVERVTTIPHLVRRELIWALSWLGLLIIWSALIPAPLEAIANPAVSPNPAKAPWYFMGLQELLLHFHPLIGAFVIPGIALLALALLPFYDVQLDSVGVYFRSRRGRYLSLVTAGLALFLTPLWIVLDEYLLNWSAWLPDWPSLITTGLFPLAVVAGGLILIDEWIKSAFKASLEERVLALFIFLLTAFLILTAVGIFFRGPGMSLYWPWEMPAAHL